MVGPGPRGRGVGLGGGTGELTDELHLVTRSASTLGIDTSAAMLARARAAPRLEFRQDDIATFSSDEPFDIVFSNAALQWVGDHRRLLPRLARLVAPAGQ